MLAFHGIFGAYGFWLPNDPRGSWSSWVGSWDLFRYGPATKVNVRHSIAHKPHDPAQRIAAKNAMRYPPVVFSGLQAQAVAYGIQQALSEHNLLCYACAILPTHVHVVIRARGMSPGHAIGRLKRRAGDALAKRGLHPMRDHVAEGEQLPMCFARRGWNVFLDKPEDVARCIQYVQDNPLKEGLRVQRWSFVETPKY